MDGLAEFEAPAGTAELVKELRNGVDRRWLQKIDDPAAAVHTSPAVKAFLELLSTDAAARVNLNN